MKSLASTSEVKYRARVEHFLHYCAVEGFEINPSTVQDYMEELHEKYMASTLWSIFAILKAYFQADYHVDLQNELPGVVRLLKQWEKTEETSQSKVFTKEQLETFLQESPNTPTSIQCKVTVVISCYGLLRISELVKLTFEQFKLEESCCFISVQRRKSSGNLRSSTFAINDPVCMDILKFYFQLFPVESQNGRFLRYCVNGQGSNKPIGKTSIGQYPKIVAQFLQLDPEGYTGHCWRRTGATILAENDITLIQLKHAGGWRSDQVAQQYIDETKTGKLQIASRLSLFQDSTLESNVESRKRLRGDHYESNSSITVDMSTAQNCTFNYFGPNHCVEYKKKEGTNENSNEL